MTVPAKDVSLIELGRVVHVGAKLAETRSVVIDALSGTLRSFTSSDVSSNHTVVSESDDKIVRIRDSWETLNEGSEQDDGEGQEGELRALGSHHRQR